MNMEQEQRNPKVIVTVETHKRLKVLAAQHGVSMGELIKRMVDRLELLPWEVK